jgi:hypothetical protein
MASRSLFGFQSDTLGRLDYLPHCLLKTELQHGAVNALQECLCGYQLT